MQTKPEYLDQLINLASKKAGSDYKLANQLGVNRSAVSMWRSGTKPCPVGDVVLMAEIAGLDPETWTARAVIAQYAGTPKGEKIARALGKAFLVTGGGLVSSTAHAAEMTNTITGGIARALGYFIQCILC